MSANLSGGTVARGQPSVSTPANAEVATPGSTSTRIPILLGIEPITLAGLRSFQAGKRGKREAYAIRRIVGDLAAAVIGEPRTTKNCHRAVVWVRPDQEATLRYLGTDASWSDSAYSALFAQIEPFLHPYN